MACKKKVLILCMGNSCRSIIAEAMVNHYLGDRWQAFSAGTDPSEVNPLARKVLEELGIETAGLRSKSVLEFIQRDDLDLVITVCDKARESCPVFPHSVPQIHIGIKDPSPFTNTAESLALPIFRSTVKEIQARVMSVLDNYAR